MKTNDLIDRLAENLTPVSNGAVARTLALGLGGGALVSFVMMLAMFGIRRDLLAALGTESYWMKFIYTGGFALLAFWTVERLSRPGTHAGKQAFFEILPFAAVAVMAFWQWNDAPASQHMHLLMGGSHTVCPWNILVLALPIFVGVLWSLSRLAPTRPVLTGTAAGLLAGAAGAWIYGLHCNESAAVFVAVWYTFGIALTGLLGAFAGRLALRW